MDFFEVLGFPVSFELESSELEERYQELSLELHPDFYGLAPEGRKTFKRNCLRYSEYSVQNSARTNFTSQLFITFAGHKAEVG
jgi:curved DNA-binding protein CbpA